MIESRLRVLTTVTLFGLAWTGVSFGQTPAPRAYSSYFIFGDSLSDSGNTFTLTGSPPAPYYQGRFSNGPVYPEYLVPTLQKHTTAAPSVKTNLNFAFGGATAAAGSPVPSLGQQVGLFQSRAITPGANDLFVVLSGANDVLNAIANPATQNGPAVTSIAQAAADAVVTNVKSMAALGAKNFIVMNLPDISRTARFVTGSGVPAASLAQTGSFAFNNAVRAGLGNAGLGADVKLTLVDVQGLLNTVLNNGAALGFTDTTHEVVAQLQAGQNPGNIDGYVFWDGIHPTTKVHALLSNALTEIINPEFVIGTGAVQGSTVQEVLDLAADAVDARMDQVRGSTTRSKADGFVSYTYRTGGRDADGYLKQYDYTAQVVTLGLDAKLSDQLTVGFAVGAESTKSDLAAAAGSFKLKGETGTLFAQWNGGAYFAEATASYGAHDVRNISRATMLGGLRTSGTTDSTAFGASLRFGGEFRPGNVRLTPFVGLRYSDGSLDGYTETGVPSLNFQYGDQDFDALVGVIGGSADWTFNAGSMPFNVGFTAIYQTDMGDDTRSVQGRLADTIAPWTTVNVANGLGDTLKVGARVSGSFGKSWGWMVSYTALFNDKADTASQFAVGVQTGF
jgi:outer membrane lipase/esterase